MDLEKLTDRARGFLQAAQTIAVREHHQRITPAHLLKALLDDEEGMAAGLIQAAGGDPKAAKLEADALVAKIPSVTGSGATQAPALDGDTIRILDQAEQVAQKAGDSYVTVERILLAMALAKGTDVGTALQNAGLTPQNLNAAIEKLRGGRTADTQGAEDRYDALKKYARDLTAAAREGTRRRGSLRRAEEICARPDRRRPRGKAGPGDRP
jgi:ATP-dependent Clp protease ATP-binding subunit ClpB